MSLPITTPLTLAQQYRAAMGLTRTAEKPKDKAVPEVVPADPFKELLSCPTLTEVQLNPGPEMLFYARNLSFFTANSGETLIVRGNATTGTDVMWTTVHGRALVLRSRASIPDVKEVCFIPHRYEYGNHFGSSPRSEWI